MSDAAQLNFETMAAWADDPNGPVALTLNQRLLPVDGQAGVVFPPTFANIGYVVDELPDRSQVALMDSVGSQANRMEPMFKSGALAALVPQVTIKTEKEVVSLLDVGHRLADALVRCSGAEKLVTEAFEAYRKRGDASFIAKLAPTTLVFGAWDSREGGAKLPRLVQATIRAWGVSELRRAAQYTPPVDYSELEVFTPDEMKKEEGDNKSPVAKRGFVHVPSGETHGGIVVAGAIRRDVLVNLVALRALRAGDEDAGRKLRHYILGLTLVAAAAPPATYLRQGCMLTADPSDAAAWEIVERSGQRAAAQLDFDGALAFAQEAASAFGVGEAKSFIFNKTTAKGDVAKARADARKEKGGKAKGAAADEA